MEISLMVTLAIPEHRNPPPGDELRLAQSDPDSKKSVNWRFDGR
jgi:hypothetical protein